MHLTTFISICLFLALSLSNPVYATSDSPLTLEDYAALPDFDMFTVSPNGELLAYRNNKDGKQMARIYSRKDGKTIRTFDMSGINVYDLDFLTDDFLIMFVSETIRIPGYSERQEFTTAMAYNLKKDKITQLLQLGEGIYEAQSWIGRIIGLSPDKKYAYMPAFIGGNLDVPEFGVMRVNLNLPKRPKVAFQGYRDSRDFFLNKNGDVIVHEILFDKKNRYEIRAKNGKKWKTIYEVDSKYYPISPVGLSLDETKLVVLDRHSSAVRSYNEISLADGSIQELTLSREDTDINHVYHDSARRVLGVAYSGFMPDYYFFDEKLNTRIQSILKLFEGNSVFIDDISDDLKHVLVRAEGSNYAGDYFVFSEGKQAEFIASTRNKITAEHVNPISRINLKARDGRTIPTLVTIPRDRVTSIKNLPAVVLPHGGPASYDKIRFDWLTQSLANEGYLVIQPQFRGSTGFGTAHYNAGFGEWGRGMQDDLSDAVNALVNKGYADKERICIMGASYGGYAALAGGAFTPELYKCIIAINGISDLNRFLKQERRDHGYDSSQLDYWKHHIYGDEELSATDLKKYSPFNQAENFKAPVMLVHAKDDAAVDMEQSNVINRALKQANKDVEFIKLRGENHYLKNEESRMILLKNAIRFINENIGNS